MKLVSRCCTDQCLTFSYLCKRQLLPTWTKKLNGNRQLNTVRDRFGLCPFCVKGHVLLFNCTTKFEQTFVNEMLHRTDFDFDLCANAILVQLYNETELNSPINTARQPLSNRSNEREWKYRQLIYVNVFDLYPFLSERLSFSLRTNELEWLASIHVDFVL